MNNVVMYDSPFIVQWLARAKRVSLLLVFFAYSTLLSATESNALPSSVKLVTGDDYFPYAHHSVPAGGWAVAIVEAAFAQMNVAASVDILPWQRAMIWTKEGRYLATFPYIYSPERGRDYLFSDPIMYSPGHIYVARASGITQASQLKGKRLCVPTSYSIEGSYKTLAAQYSMTLHRVQDGLGCVRHVEKGWSDAGITNDYLANPANRKRFGLDSTLAVLEQELPPEPLFLLVSRDHPNALQWIQRFNLALQHINDNGRRARIDAQYTAWLEK